MTISRPTIHATATWRVRWGSRRERPGRAGVGAAVGSAAINDSARRTGHVGLAEGPEARIAVGARHSTGRYSPG